MGEAGATKLAISLAIEEAKAVIEAAAIQGLNQIAGKGIVTLTAGQYTVEAGMLSTTAQRAFVVDKEGAVWVNALLLITFCLIIGVMQVLTALRLRNAYTPSAAGRRSRVQEKIFDLGALVFLTGLQALLVYSMLGKSANRIWSAGAIVGGIALILLAIIINASQFFETKT